MSTLSTNCIWQYDDQGRALFVEAQSFSMPEPFDNGYATHRVDHDFSCTCIVATPQQGKQLWMFRLCPLCRPHPGRVVESAALGAVIAPPLQIGDCILPPVSPSGGADSFCYRGVDG